MKTALLTTRFSEGEMDLYDDLFAVADIQRLPVTRMIKRLIKHHLRHDPAMWDAALFDQLYDDSPYESPQK